MSLIRRTRSRFSFSDHELPPCDSARCATQYLLTIQHDCSLIKNELPNVASHTVHEYLKANKVGKIVACDVVNEFSDETMSNTRKIRHRSILILVRKELIVFENKDVHEQH